MAISVFIVDDDTQTRKILAGWVSRTSGFRLAGECGDAESALKVLPEKGAEVVLMDINMPGMSGVGLVFHAQFEVSLAGAKHATV